MGYKNECDTFVMNMRNFQFKHHGSSSVNGISFRWSIFNSCYVIISLKLQCVQNGAVPITANDDYLSNVKMDEKKHACIWNINQTRCTRLISLTHIQKSMFIIIFEGKSRGNLQWGCIVARPANQFKQLVRIFGFLFEFSDFHFDFSHFSMCFRCVFFLIRQTVGAKTHAIRIVNVFWYE